MLKDEKHTAIDKMLNEVLTSEPEFKLKTGFADRMAAKVGREYALKEYFREFLIYLGALIGLAAVYAGVTFIWYSANVKEWLNFLQNNLSLVIGINVLIVFILLADKVLLPYLFYRYSIKQN